MDFDLTDYQREQDEEDFDEFVRENHPQYEEAPGAGYDMDFQEEIMSMIYCEICDLNIDTDFHAEHFEDLHEED